MGLDEAEVTFRTRGTLKQVVVRMSLLCYFRLKEVSRLTIPLIKAIRKNHGLEHATVSLLLERGTAAPIGGYSIPRGFVIWAKAPPATVANAARDALQFLKEGHSDLAVSAHCGTNIVVSALLGGLAAYLAGRGRGLGPIVRGAMFGLLVAKILGPPIGKLVQRNVTVSAEPAGMSVKSIRVLRQSPLSIVWISTTH